MRWEGVGDEVLKGDVLNSGIVDLYDDSATVYKQNPVDADGDIELDVNHRYRDEFYLIHETKQYTGRKQREYIYQYKDRLLFVENVLNKFESNANYDIIYEYIQPKVGKIPIYFLNITKQTTL